jgi:hypothetical protein
MREQRRPSVEDRRERRGELGMSDRAIAQVLGVNDRRSLKRRVSEIVAAQPGDGGFAAGFAVLIRIRRVRARRSGPLEPQALDRLVRPLREFELAANWLARWWRKCVGKRIVDPGDERSYAAVRDIGLNTPATSEENMSTSPTAPVRVASEDVIINAPMSYVGSAQRIMRIRRRAEGGRKLAAITVLAILLILIAWVFVTGWYLTWGLLLVPYRLLRRGARKRKVEALRHRELMGTIQGSAAASAAAIVASTAGSQVSALTPTAYAPGELVGDADRERNIEELRGHMLAGRLTAEEFEARVEAVHRARTRGDLDSAGMNLP